MCFLYVGTGNWAEGEKNVMNELEKSAAVGEENAGE